MNKAEKIVDRLKFSIRYPYTIGMSVKRALCMPEAKRMGLQVLAPNYIFFGKFDDKSVIIDAGCGYEAELSRHLIEKYNIKTAYAIDPTEKHATSLQEIGQRYGNRFVHLRYALAERETELEFFETLEKESGSLLPEHTNIRHDRIRKYKVSTITLSKLLDLVANERVALIKIDIEGMEYALFENTDPAILKRFDQIFVEFHHYSVRSFNRRDTRKTVKMLEGYGLKSFSLDTVNYLFYW